MKKLISIFTALILLGFVSTACAWTVSWGDTVNEDGYILKYKGYPSGYSYPSNPAPANLIQDMTGATVENLPVDTVKYELPSASFTPGSRYVFTIQATLDDSVSGYSDFVCWTWPIPANVVEMETESGAGITINIYQKP